MATAAQHQPSGQFLHIPLGEIRPNPDNPRKHFDKTPLNELAESIKAHGVRQPILVRPHPDGTGFQLVVGERRWRASKLAGKSTVPGYVDEINDHDALEIMVIENLQREDVHPLDEGLGYQALLKSGGTAETVAAKVGKSASYVYQRLKLCDLIAAAHSHFRSGFLTAAHCIDIARLQPADQERALDFCTKEEWGNQRKLETAPPFRALRQWIQDNVQLNLDKAPFDIKDAKLVPSAGACTDCPKRTGANPTLFEGLGRNNCMDPACYQQKKMALVHINLDKVEEKHGVKPILISHEWGGDEKSRKAKGVLYEDSYRATFHKGGRGNKIEKDSCPATRLAVYVDGDRDGMGSKKAGETTFVCTARGKCKVHEDVYTSGGNGVSAAQRRNQRITNHYRTELLKAVAAGMKTPKRDDLQLAAIEAVRALGHYRGTPLVQALGWNASMIRWGGDAAARKKFEGMSESDLLRHLVLMALASDLTGSGYAIQRPKLIEAVAKRHGVKAEQLLKESKAKFTKKAKVQTSAKRSKAAA